MTDAQMADRKSPGTPSIDLQIRVLQAKTSRILPARAGPDNGMPGARGTTVLSDSGRNECRARRLRAYINEDWSAYTA